MEKILCIRCPNCGWERKMIWRKGMITKKYRLCFRCNKMFKVHTHISKYSAIVKGG